MAESYDKGTTVTLWANFTVSGTLTDPSTITLKTRAPDGTTNTYTYASAQITKDSAGIYHKDVLVDQAGNWGFRFEGTGTAAGAKEGDLHVRASRF